MNRPQPAAPVDRHLNDKLITCILPRGAGHDMIIRLKAEKEIVTCVLNSARGIGISTLMEIRTIGPLSEKDVLQVTVPADRADELFEWIYFEASVDQPHGGFMYLHPLTAATPFFLPEVPPEK